MRSSSGRLLGMMIGLSVAGAALWAIYSLLGKVHNHKKSKQVESLQYSVQQYRDVDEAQILFVQASTIDPSLEKLHAIALVGNDAIAVAGDRAIVLMDPTGKETGRITLDEPATCLASEGGNSPRLFVGMKNHTEVYGLTGEKEASWTSLGERAEITSIAVTSNEVFIADAGNRMVWRFDSSGALRGQFDGKRETGGGSSFVIPSPYFDLAIGTNGKLWIVNPGKQRIQNYSYDGNPRKAWGRSGMRVQDFCGCCNPSHLAIGPAGDFVTSEKGIPRVKFYDRNGKFAGVVAAPEVFDEDTTDLDLAVDSQSRVYVLDPGAGVIRIFERKSPKGGNSETES